MGRHTVTDAARHLAADLQTVDRRLVVELACSGAREWFVQERHTVLAGLATCPACRAVHAALVVVNAAGMSED